MRITTMAVASVLAAATVVGGPAVAHAADTDAGTGAGAATVSGTHTTTARTAALAGWREGPYSDPEIAAAAAQLTIGIGRATAYYLVQVWDTVRQTTNWWIHYT